MSDTPKSLSFVEEGAPLPEFSESHDFRIKMLFGRLGHASDTAKYGFSSKLPNTGADGTTTAQASQTLGKQVENTFRQHFGQPPVEVEGEWLPQSYLDAERAGGRTMLTFLTPEEARVIARLRSESETP